MRILVDITASQPCIRTIGKCAIAIREGTYYRKPDIRRLSIEFVKFLCYSIIKRDHLIADDTVLADGSLGGGLIGDPIAAE